MTFHGPMRDDRPEEQSHWGNLPRIVLTVFALLIAAGITVFVSRPDFFAANRAEAAARFPAQQASSAPSAAPASSAPASSAAPSSSVSAAPSSRPAQSEADAEVALAQASKPLRVQVSIAQQKVTVLDAKGRTVKAFVCSSGKSGEETPTGTYTVSDRGKSFYNPQIKEGAYYWTRFDGPYLFHSVPFDGDYRMEPEEAEKLGTPASHGCIRLPVEDAKWIYENLPKGTKVVIA